MISSGHKTILDLVKNKQSWPNFSVLTGLPVNSRLYVFDWPCGFSQASAISEKISRPLWPGHPVSISTAPHLSASSRLLTQACETVDLFSSIVRDQDTCRSLFRERPLLGYRSRLLSSCCLLLPGELLLISSLSLISFLFYHLPIIWLWGSWTWGSRPSYPNSISMRINIWIGKCKCKEYHLLKIFFKSHLGKA